MTATTPTASPALAQFRAELERDFAAKFPRSLAIRERRARVLLDETSHAVRWTDPFQVTVERADGAVVVDLDGRRHVDYWQGHYANVLGHNPPVVRAALAESLARGQGLQSGMLHAVEADVAQLLAARTGQDVVRFTTSGALATFYSVLLARAFTGRSRVVKVAGGWHGSQPFGLKGVSARGGSFDHLDSEGLPGTTSEDVELVRFNDVDGLERLFADHGDRVACFLLEPWLGSGGGIAASADFLRSARRCTQQHGALLLCDEIIAGFRFRAGDLSALYGVKPDLLVLGKVIGGGMPVAAVAGRRDVMQLASRASRRVKFEGGTYSAHPLSMVAAKTMVEHLVANEREVYAELARRGAWLREQLESLFAELAIPAWISGWPNDVVAGSSIVMVHLAGERGGRPQSAEQLHGTRGAHPFVTDELLRAVLLLEGVHARHGLGAVSTVHDDDDLAATIGAYRRTLARLRAARLV
jgi:glutamate-1-semialdehyde 2,1-aminomutase